MPFNRRCFPCFKKKKSEVLVIALLFLILDGILLALMYLFNNQNSPYFCLFFGYCVASLLSSIILLVATYYDNRFLMLPFLIIQGFTFGLVFFLCMLAIGFLGLIAVVAIDPAPDAMNFMKSVIEALQASDRDQALIWTSIFLAASLAFLTTASFGYGVVLEHYQSFKKEKAQPKRHINDSILINIKYHPDF